MKYVFLMIFFLYSHNLMAFDLGFGSSSITSGRPVPALALGIEKDKWGGLYRSTGVQTTIYAQNAWTVAGYHIIHTEQAWTIQSSIGAGLGASHIIRAYRPSLTSPVEKDSDTVIGPSLYLKIKMGPIFLGFDTVLGLSPKIFQHIALNFQDVSHVTIGVSL